VRVATSGGAVTVLAAEVSGGPGGLAVDDTNVYYSDQTGVFARPLAAPASAIAFGQSTLHGNAIALGGGSLAMNEITSIGSGDVALFRTDGMMRVVVSPSLAQPLAVDDRGVYINGAGTLERLALDGSGATLLAIEPPRAVALAPSAIYFTDGTAIYSLPK
jgi:D-serine dehydratase